MNICLFYSNARSDIGSVGSLDTKKALLARDVARTGAVCCLAGNLSGTVEGFYTLKSIALRPCVA